MSSTALISQCRPGPLRLTARDSWFGGGTKETKDLSHWHILKTTPGSELIKDLMCRTFFGRWRKYTDPDDPHPSSLTQYLVEYPYLKKLTYVII